MVVTGSYLDNLIQCRISANAEFCPRNIVRDRCWDADQRNLEFGMLITRFIHLKN